MEERYYACGVTQKKLHRLTDHSEIGAAISVAEALQKMVETGGLIYQETGKPFDYVVITRQSDGLIVWEPTGEMVYDFGLAS